MNVRYKSLFGMVLALALLSIYLWYLRQINYPINWLLAVFLVIVVMAFSYFLTKFFNKNKERNK